MNNEERKAFDLTVDNHARAMDRVAELEREVERQTNNCLNLQQQIEDMKAQPGGVVLPELLQKVIDHCDEGQLPDDLYNRLVDEVARLNQQPVSGVYQCPRCATSMQFDESAKPASGGDDDEYMPQGIVQAIMQSDEVDAVGLAAKALSSGGVDERAAFEEFCKGFHRGSSLDGEIHSDSRYPALNGQWIYDDWNVQSAWATWQARAALAQSERVPDIDPLLTISRKILAKLQHPTESVHAGDMWKLEEALAPFPAAPSPSKQGGV